MDRKAAALKVALAGEEEAYQRVIFEAEVGAELAGAFVLGEAVGDLVEDDGDVDVTVGGELVAGGRAVEVDAAQSAAVEHFQALPGLGGNFQGLLSRGDHGSKSSLNSFFPPIIVTLGPRPCNTRAMVGVLGMDDRRLTIDH